MEIHMTTLTLETHRVNEKDISVHSHLNGEDLDLQNDSVFALEWTEQEQEDLRWYLEDYPVHTTEPSPQIAARIENALADVGRTLFRRLFQETTNSRNVWEAAKRDL